MEQSNLFIPNLKRRPPPPTTSTTTTTTIMKEANLLIKGQRCDVCGATGNKEDKLVSCSKCSTTQDMASLDTAKQEYLRKIGKSCKIMTMSVDEVKKLKSGSELPVKRPSSSILNANVHNEQPIDGGKPCKKLTPSVKRTEKISYSATPKDVAPPPEITSGQNVPLATAKNTNAAKETKLLNPKNFEQYFLSRPSTSIAWRGGFQICDSVSARVGEPYRFFEGQPPSRITKQAHELLESMPLMLKAKLIPLGKLWPNLFPHSLPDLRDIALYILPSKRSEENLASLFELMESEKSVMMSCIDGVDLIIFTSKRLRIDAQYLMKHIKAERFLWGMFRRPKKNQTVQKKLVEMPCPPIGFVPDCQSNMDDSRVLDMEIDMIGGEEIVGEVDAVRNEFIPIHWAPTPTGYVKLNVAVCFNEDGKFFTAVGIVRDDSAQWMFGYSLKVNRIEKLMTVMDALNYGLQCLWDGGRRKVLVQSSSKEAVELLELEQLPAAGNPLALISQKCRELIKANWVCQISLINEEANLCANWLACHPQGINETTILFAPPREMLHLYESDLAREQAASGIP
ncbi:hypothetical protein ACFE04_020705 [Oxalis oulophora]